MSQAVIEPILLRHRVTWEGPCKIIGPGAGVGAAHRLSVTEEGHLVFSHGPEDGAPAWTHTAPAPHPPGSVLACWEAAGYEFLFRFDRNWDPMVATIAGPDTPHPRLWSALRPHLLLPTREQTPLWQSRFYCRCTLRAELSPSGVQEHGDAEPALTRFVRAFAYEEHLSLSLCSPQPEEPVGLYGTINVALPYAALAEVCPRPAGRCWVLGQPIAVGGQSIRVIEVEIPPLEAGEWAALDQLIAERRGAGREDAEGRSGRLVSGVYAIGGIAAGRQLVEAEDRARILVGESALVLLEAATGGCLATIPYATIHAAAIERQDPADDLLIVAPDIAVVLRQAGVGLLHGISHGAKFVELRQKLETATAAVVWHCTGIPGRPESVPTALRLEGETLHADWGVGAAALPVAQMPRRRLEREAGQVRLVIGGPVQEWAAMGAPERLVPLGQALDEAALPGQLARESMADLYRRWQRRRSELLLWGVLSDIASLDMLLERLAGIGTVGEAGPGAASGAREAVGCDLLATHMENVKAKLSLCDLFLPYGFAREEGIFLQHLGEPATPVLDRSCAYAERAVKAILRSPLTHLQRSLAEIEKNLDARDELRQVTRPGKLTLGFDASYCATVATALGASVFGPLGAVAGAALSGLKLKEDNHAHNELQESLIRDYEVNALTWWRHLNDRIVPLLVRELVSECRRLSRSLTARDHQVCERLAAQGRQGAESRFRAALTSMLLAHARFRWSRIDAGEHFTAGEILDRLTAAPVPAAVFGRLFLTMDAVADRLISEEPSIFR